MSDSDETGSDGVLPVERSSEPITVESMAAALRALGVESDDCLLVHASLSSLGWVNGAAPAVVDALQRILTDGTLVMPTHSPDVSNPEWWENPPVPEDWYATVRETMPAYRPAVTPTRGMGAVAECFRSYPGVERSAHPMHSFAAWGTDSAFVTERHPLDDSLGDDSPLARVYDRDGRVLFLGTTHATNTSLHLAEYRADLGLERESKGSAVVRDGEREWVTFEDLAIDDEDFPECGAAFEAAHPEAVSRGEVGVAECALLDQRPMVDVAVEWFEANR
ncbi:AAC(3) family N-acetyltransferase [Salinirubellus salinus]|uniref:AAC(3) family N-acetyltransferase n=1 Tax=Salinirubellus salinus TaxID=1364945 RepID=A0A9E7R224_9EURY|nr:AAC(3) family N-acetyltransferase [Salinirubellus salinus]UWM54058.1 AAC(3) family N-acetyltransferase [Salinirubellus salinus]